MGLLYFYLIKDSETGRANGWRGVFWWGNLRQRDHLENLGVGGSIIVKLTFKKNVERGLD